MNHQGSTGKTATASLSPTLPLSNRDAGCGSLLLFLASPLHLPREQASLLCLLDIWDSGVSLSPGFEPYTSFRGVKATYLGERTAWEEVSNNRTASRKF